MLSGAGQPPYIFPSLYLLRETKRKRGMILRSWLNEQKSGSYPDSFAKSGSRINRKNKPVEWEGPLHGGPQHRPRWSSHAPPGAKITQHHYPRTSLECCVTSPYEGGAVGNDCIKASVLVYTLPHNNINVCHRAGTEHCRNHYAVRLPCRGE